MRISGEVIREPRTRSEVLLGIEGARLQAYGDSITFPGFYPVPVTPKGREYLRAFFDEARRYAEELE